jgi:hypothetical protein
VNKNDTLAGKIYGYSGVLENSMIDSLPDAVTGKNTFGFFAIRFPKHPSWGNVWTGALEVKTHEGQASWALGYDAPFWWDVSGNVGYITHVGWTQDSVTFRDFATVGDSFRITISIPEQN